jgi:hypothetical protein
MTVHLTNAFLANTRGVTLKDSGGLTWAINSITNEITATGGVGSSAPYASGFGTPTGNVVIANFPGATATLVQCSETIAELIAVLKSAGIIAA